MMIISGKDIDPVYEKKQMTSWIKNNTNIQVIKL